MNTKTINISFRKDFLEKIGRKYSISGQNKPKDWASKNKILLKKSRNSARKKVKILTKVVLDTNILISAIVFGGKPSS